MSSDNRECILCCAGGMIRVFTQWVTKFYKIWKISIHELYTWKERQGREQQQQKEFNFYKKQEKG